VDEVSAKNSKGHRAFLRDYKKSKSDPILLDERKLMEPMQSSDCVQPVDSAVQKAEKRASLGAQKFTLGQNNPSVQGSTANPRILGDLQSLSIGRGTNWIVDAFPETQLAKASRETVVLISPEMAENIGTETKIPDDEEDRTKRVSGVVSERLSPCADSPAQRSSLCIRRSHSLSKQASSSNIMHSTNPSIIERRSLRANSENVKKEEARSSERVSINGVELIAQGSKNLYGVVDPDKSKSSLCIGRPTSNVAIRSNDSLVSNVSNVTSSGRNSGDLNSSWRKRNISANSLRMPSDTSLASTNATTSSTKSFVAKIQGFFAKRSSGVSTRKVVHYAGA